MAVAAVIESTVDERLEGRRVANGPTHDRRKDSKELLRVLVESIDAESSVYGIAVDTVTHLHSVLLYCEHLGDRPLSISRVMKVNQCQIGHSDDFHTASVVPCKGKMQSFLRFESHTISLDLGVLE